MDYRSFIDSGNPLAFALMAKMDYNRKEQVRLKADFLRLVLGEPVNPARRSLLVDFIETYMPLHSVPAVGKVTIKAATEESLLNSRRPIRGDPMRQHLHRRDMIRRGTSAVATAFVMGFKPLLAAPAARWFKIGACDWNLGRAANPESFEVAKEIGLDGVQISMGVLRGLNTTDPAVRRQYREATARTGLEIASLAIGEMNQVPLKSDPQAAEWLAQSIGVCQDLGLGITMPAFFGKGDLDMGNTAEIDRVVGVLKDVAPEAEKAGVVIGLENYLSAADNLTLIDRVNSPALSVYYDVGNSTDKGYDILAEIRELGRKGRLCQLHAKDGRHRLGEGRIDFGKVRGALDDVGYSGWFVLEAAAPGGLMVDYPHYARFLRGIFPERVG